MGITKLGPNRYRVVVVDKSGRAKKRREKKRLCKGTLAQAQAMEETLRAELLFGKNERMTLGAYAASWLKAKAPSLKDSTLQKYGNDLSSHILPALGDFYVDALRPQDIKEFLAKDKGAGHSKANRLRLLRTLAKDAKADGLTDEVFTARVPIPEGKDYDDENPNILTGPELARLIAAIPDYWRPVVFTIGTTGLRWGEASALRWKDIDFEGHRIFVRGNNYKGAYVPRPKTKAGKRRPPLLPVTEYILREHRQGRGLKDWVFPTQRGTLHAGTPLRAVLNRACEKAEVPRVTTHGLRRTWNDLLRQVSSGAVVQSIIGHTSDAMTNHYSRITDGERTRAGAAALALVEDLVEAGGQNPEGQGEEC